MDWVGLGVGAGWGLGKGGGGGAVGCTVGAEIMGICLI